MEGLKSLTHLQILSLSLDKGGLRPNNMCDTLLTVLPHLTTLHTLSVDFLSVYPELEFFVDTVCGSTNIKTLFLNGMDRKDLPQQCAKKLTEHGVTISFNDNKEPMGLRSI